MKINPFTIKASLNNNKIIFDETQYWTTFNLKYTGSTVVSFAGWIQTPAKCSYSDQRSLWWTVVRTTGKKRTEGWFHLMSLYSGCPKMIIKKLYTRMNQPKSLNNPVNGFLWNSWSRFYHLKNKKVAKAEETELWPEERAAMFLFLYSAGLSRVPDHLSDHEAGESRGAGCRHWAEVLTWSEPERPVEEQELNRKLFQTSAWRSAAGRLSGSPSEQKKKYGNVAKQQTSADSGIMEENSLYFWTCSSQLTFKIPK